MVQVTFLGTGDAFAVGLRTNVALLVRASDAVVQIECGPAVLHQLDRVGVSPDQVTHLFISHRHGDHLLGLPMFLLMRSVDDTANPLVILGSSDVIQSARQLMELVYTELRDRLDRVSWVELPGDRQSSQELTPAVRMSAHPMPHSNHTPSMGVRLDLVQSNRSMVYTGDTIYTAALAEFAAGCDLLIHEANFSEVLHPNVNAAMYGHSTARQAGHTAAQAGCRILALVHMSADCIGREAEVRAEVAQAFGGEILIPTDGATLYL